MNILSEKISWLFSTFLFGILLFSCGETKSKPNIILIMADDLGYETLACNGGQSYQTPNLDRLAKNGMRFTQCFSTPLCTPSRVQIMTGLYNHRNYKGFGILDSNETTFAHLLKKEGYQTAITGKWQLYGNDRQQKLVNQVGSLPNQAGFDEYCLWQVTEKGFRYKSPTVRYGNQGVVTTENGYGPDLFLDFAKGFISDHQKDPFFLYFPMCLTHDPFQPTPDDKLDFAEFKPDSTKLNDTTYFSNNLNYLDKILGQLADHLVSLELDENTCILFVGDNGTDRQVVSTWNNLQINGMKGFPERDGTHVPMIAYWPGTIHPAQNDNLIDFTDFLPSVLDIAGGQTDRTDGHSFYPLLKDSSKKGRDWIFCHYDPNWGRFKKSVFIQNKKYKLYEDGRFYNILLDPHEKKPIEEESLSDHEKDLLSSLSNSMTDVLKEKS